MWGGGGASAHMWNIYILEFVCVGRVTKFSDYVM